MEKIKSYDIICNYIPIRIRKYLLNLSISDINSMSEIRLRVDKPVVLYYCNRFMYLTSKGKITSIYDKSECIIVKKEEIEEIVKVLCRYSVHSFSNELTQGFFTLPNGIRVGISGAISKGENKCIRYISGLNFRVSRQIIGCADKIFESIYSLGLKSILICGTVNTGKTTILRDLCRLCGNICKVTLIDERNEISASSYGIPENDIGLHTDVIIGNDRDSGINMAVRTLSPQIIFCDEISNYNDADALLNGHGCGVKFVASVHAENMNDLKKRVFMDRLTENEVFDYAIFLDGGSFPGKIKEIRRLK